MSNATIELLSARRSVPARQMQGPAPSEEQLRTFLTIAARVPDHGKLAPWRFIVFSGEAREKAAQIIAAAFAADNPEADEKRLAAERERMTAAPLVVAVVSRAAPHPKIPEWEQVLSAGAVCMNLIVAANAMGFATSWVTGWCAYDRRVLDAFGLAPDERIAGFVHIGTASEKPADRPRPDLSAIVTRFGE